MSEASVVIPLYNKEPHIARALNSVLNQTFQDFEVIVINDGSTDGGADVVRSFDDLRIRLIQQENQGVSAARNRGIEVAEGKLIAFLDADDEWFPGHLEKILRLNEEYPEAGAYATAYNFCQPNGETAIAKYMAIPPSPWEGVLPSYFKSNALGDHPLCSSSVGIPRKIFNEVGVFKVGVGYGEDEDLWGRIALFYPVVFSWQVGATYHRDAINRSCYLFFPLEEEEVFVKTVRHAKRNGDLDSVIQNDLNECIARKEIDFAIQNVMRGQNKEARRILVHCNTELFLSKKIFWILLSLIPVSIFTIICNVKSYFSH